MLFVSIRIETHNMILWITQKINSYFLQKVYGYEDVQAMQCDKSDNDICDNLVIRLGENYMYINCIKQFYLNL